ncbi:MAG: hypothetical protein ACRDPB_07180, partial [Nocardioidaceae bacterium]
TKFAGLETKFAGLETKFAGVDGRFVGVEGKIAGVEGKFDAKFEAVESQLRAMRWMIGLMIVLLAAVLGKLIFG